MRSYLSFYVNRKRCQVDGEAAFLPLTTYLREYLGLCGTKVVCAEGDCGSCSVFLGRPTAEGMKYRTVCGCIQYLFQVDASHIVTIEGLQDGDGLSPIQASMVRSHGAQCGFCTPGFVIAMQQHYERNGDNERESLRRSLVGNLCRCTGYEPILQAGQGVVPSLVKSIAEIYSREPIADELLLLSREEVTSTCLSQISYKPVTLSQAIAFREQNPDAVLVAGGTDLGVLANKGKRAYAKVISLLGISGFDQIQVEGDYLVAGGGCSIQDLEDASREAMPEFAKFLAWFGSPPIKHAGTLGGNIANGSPIGDTMPALFVLNAEIELVGQRSTRRVNMNQFYTGYRTTVMGKGELISRIYIPLPGKLETFRLYKVSQRKDLDISTYSAAYWMKVNAGRIHDVRIALGGVAPTICRLPRTEEFLKGQAHTFHTWTLAGERALEEIAPISDVRGSSAYRKHLVAMGMTRFCHHSGGAP
jgi:xanthine dehydrogenase small subunit